MREINSIFEAVMALTRLTRRGPRPSFHHKEDMPQEMQQGAEEDPLADDELPF